MNDFSAAEALLRTTLGKCVLAVDHIGSAAVPGLAAKPMLDIDVTLSGLDDVPEASANLIRLDSNRVAVAIIDASRQFRPNRLSTGCARFPRDAKRAEEKWSRRRFTLHSVPP